VSAPTSPLFTNLAASVQLGVRRPRPGDAWAEASNTRPYCRLLYHDGPHPSMVNFTRPRRRRRS
jgi:hypothetical protein